MRIAFDAVAEQLAGWLKSEEGQLKNAVCFVLVKPRSCIKRSAWRNGRKEIRVIYLL